MTMRLIVGESSTTKILFIFCSSGIIPAESFGVTHFHRQGSALAVQVGVGVHQGSAILRERAKISQRLSRDLDEFRKWISRGNHWKKQLILHPRSERIEQ